MGPGAALFDLLLLQVDERADDHDDVVEQFERFAVHAGRGREDEVGLEALQHALDVVFQLERPAFADLFRDDLLEVVVVVVGGEGAFQVGVRAGGGAVVVLVVVVVAVGEAVLEVVEVFAGDQVRVGFELGEEAGLGEDGLVVGLDAEASGHEADAPVQGGRNQVLELVALIELAVRGFRLGLGKVFDGVLSHLDDQVVQDEMDLVEVLPQVDRDVQLHRDIVRPDDEISQTVGYFRHTRTEQNLHLAVGQAEDGR